MRRTASGSKSLILLEEKTASSNYNARHSNKKMEMYLSPLPLPPKNPKHYKSPDNKSPNLQHPKLKKESVSCKIQSSSLL